jgi:hypothetical protein
MERLLPAQPSRLAWASTVAVMGALVAACGGSVGTSSPPGSQALGSPGATASPSPRSSTPTAAQSPLDPLDFDITGSIGGKQVVGKLTNGSFTVPCVGAGAGQVLVVHWAGTASQTSTQLHGEIDFKPGSWTIEPDCPGHGHRRAARWQGSGRSRCHVRDRDHSVERGHDRRDVHERSGYDSPLGRLDLPGRKRNAVIIHDVI